jgi:hypothetical protein
MPEQAVQTRGASLPGPGSPITLQLTADRLVSVPLRTIDEDGAFVLSLHHPQALGVDKYLTISWERGERWVLVEARILPPRFRPHPEAGRLRVRPERAVAHPFADPRPTRDDAPAGAAATASSGEPATPQADGAADAGDVAADARPTSKQLGKLRPWQGEHPTVNVAIRLSSGRVRTLDVRRIDEESALVLELKRPTSIADGEPIEVAWCTRYDWLTARTEVMPNKADGDPDAGLLRVGLVDGPDKHANRRGGARVNVKIGVRGNVVKSRAVDKNTPISVETIDVSVGGISFGTDLPLQVGDRIDVRLLGEYGQIGETTIEVRRIAPPSGGGLSKVGAAFVTPPKEVTKAMTTFVQRHT